MLPSVILVIYQGKGETNRYNVPRAAAATFTQETEMENLAATILLTAAFYLWLFCPRQTTEPETTAPAIAVQPKPVTVTQPLPVAAFKPQPKPAKTTAMATESDLITQPIRRLKSLAKGRVKNYSSLTKAQLSQRLAGIVPLSELT